MSRVVERTVGLAVEVGDPGAAAINAALEKARKEADTIEQVAAELRLASFRTYLQATVDGMSALVPDVLALAGADVARAFDAVRPGHLWPHRTAIRRSGGAAGIADKRFSAGGKGSAFAFPAGSISGSLVGDAVIAEGLFGPWVEARVVGTSLEAVLRSDGFELVTRVGVAYLTMAGRLPQTVVALCRGRALDKVVDYHLLRGRGYVVDLAVSRGDRTSLLFKVGRTAIVPPWAKGSA